MARAATDQPSNIPVEVRFTASGTPLAVRYDEKIWPVTAEPAHWFTNADTGKIANQASVKDGTRGDIEHWRVQVRLTSDSGFRTFELRRVAGVDQWVLARITDNGGRLLPSLKRSEPQCRRRLEA